MALLEPKNADPDKSYTGRFYAMYAALAVIFLVAVVSLALAFILPTKLAVSHGQLNSALQSSDAQLVKTAENFAASNAQDNQVTLTAQRLVKVTHPKKGVAVVVLNVDSAAGQHYQLTITMVNGIWSPAGIQVQPTP